MQPTYDAVLRDKIAEATPLANVNAGFPEGVAKWVYRDWQQLHAALLQLDVQADEKAMVPRTAYKGIISLPRGPHRELLLVPDGSPSSRLYPYNDPIV